MTDKSTVERVANAIWLIRREHEDRCDIELADLSADHSVWDEARAAVAAGMTSASVAEVEKAIGELNAHMDSDDFDVSIQGNCESLMLVLHDLKRLRAITHVDGRKISGVCMIATAGAVLNPASADSRLLDLAKSFRENEQWHWLEVMRTENVTAIEARKASNEAWGMAAARLESILAAPQAAPAGMVMVPREHNDDEDCNCGKAGYAIDWNAAAPAAGMNPTVDQERDMLAKAIRDAAVKAGIARADASMTGPMLLMLCADLANAAAPSQGPGFIVVKEHVWHPVPGDRPELAYLWPAAFGQMVFQDAEAAHTFIQQPPGLPLGWVVLRLGNGAFAKPEAAPAPQVVVPTVCDGKEQEAFEDWAKSQKYDMKTHPLHWLFLDRETYAARQGWAAAIRYVGAMLAAAPAAQVAIEGPAVPISVGRQEKQVTHPSLPTFYQTRLNFGSADNAGNTVAFVFGNNSTDAEEQMAFAEKLVSAYNRDYAAPAVVVDEAMVKTIFSNGWDACWERYCVTASDMEKDWKERGAALVAELGQGKANG